MATTVEQTDSYTVNIIWDGNLLSAPEYQIIRRSDGKTISLKGEAAELFAETIGMIRAKSGGNPFIKSEQVDWLCGGEFIAWEE